MSTNETTSLPSSPPSPEETEKEQTIRTLEKLETIISSRKIPLLTSSSTDVSTALLSISQHLLSQISKQHDDLIDNDVIYGNDADMIWEQVDLCNEGIMKMVNRGIRKLVKGRDRGEKGEIRLLNDWDEEEEDSDDDEEKFEESDGEEIDSVGDDEEGGEDDEETKRIKARMERAMADASDSDEEEDGEEEGEEEMNTMHRDVEDEEEYDSDLDAAAVELNDGFFNLKAMEDFADDEDDFHDPLHSRHKYREDEEVDALNALYRDERDDDSDEEEDEEEDPANMTAADFFGAPIKKYLNKKITRLENWIDEEGDDDEFAHHQDNLDNYDDEPDKSSEWPARPPNQENTNNNVDISATQPKTPHGKQSLKLQQHTKQIEEHMIAEKPWQMTGEVNATSRPLNSLVLDKIADDTTTPQFEMADKVAPLITIEHTQNLETIIQQRILAEDWDDVLPRQSSSILPSSSSKDEIILSQEKSKLGLSEIYERQYLKEAMGYDAEKAQQSTEKEKMHGELRELFTSLCSKLDSLSNYHFTPRPVGPDDVDLKPTSTAPAISLEEAVPLYTASSKAITPQQVYQQRHGKDGVLKGESELTTEERKRNRRLKKTQRRKRRQQKRADAKIVAKTNPASLAFHNPYEKEKLRQDLSTARSRGKVVQAVVDSKAGGTSSSTFFKRLQEEQQSGVDYKKRRIDDYDRKKKVSSSIKL